MGMHPGQRISSAGVKYDSGVVAQNGLAYYFVTFPFRLLRRFSP